MQRGAERLDVSVTEVVTEDANKVRPVPPCDICVERENPKAGQQGEELVIHSGDSLARPQRSNL